VEKSIQASDERWFTVRIMPYRTLDDRIDGVVITFSDITVAKKLEAQLRERQSVLEKHFTEKAGDGQGNAPPVATPQPTRHGGGKARQPRKQ
jgi:hypothetical protein